MRTKAKMLQTQEKKDVQLLKPPAGPAPLIRQLTGLSIGGARTTTEEFHLEIELCRKFLVLTAVTFAIDAPLAIWMLYEVSTGIEPPASYVAVATTLAVLQILIDGEFSTFLGPAGFVCAMIFAFLLRETLHA